MPKSPSIVQICYIVEDLDTAVDHWIDTLGVGPFFVAKDMSGVAVDYKGTPGGLDMSVALGQAGDLQIELIQVLGTGPSVYTDMYKAGETGLHHVAVFTGDFEQELQDHVARGHEMNTRGLFAGDKFAYMDTRSATGCFTELYENGPGLRGMYRKIAEAARGWDGQVRTYPLADALS